MKIVLVTANWPPVACGVGDHSLRTVQAWQQQKHALTVLTSATHQQEPLTKIAGVKVNSTIPGWQLNHAWTIRQQIKQEQPDAVVVQWVPYLYSSRGTSLGLPLAMLLLPAAIKERIVFLHELWQTGWSLKALLLQIIQRFAVLVLTMRATRIFTTVAAWRNMLQTHIPWHRHTIEHLTAGSNFWSTAKGPKEIDVKRVIVVSPGSAGQLEKFIVKAWQKLRELDPEVELVCIGGRHERSRYWQPLAQDKRVKFTGYLEGEAIRRQIRSGALAWAPFADGLTARRGSALASIALGVPVIASTGRNADYDFFKNAGTEFCEPEVTSWANATLRLMNDPERLRQQRQEAWDFGRLHLNPQKLAQRLLKPSSGQFGD